ncbi:hypothetical protein GOV09_03820 [Candidatus Woesearchaeota archaeon]|nr:hypothetical protein [Candidatus Woesearchaeota archaeon]
MTYQFKTMLYNLDYHELLSLKNDFESDGSFLTLLDTRIKELEKQHKQFCATCSSEMDTKQVNNFTILFGPDDFKKRASFCGMDCLEYFLKELKEIKDARTD